MLGIRTTGCSRYGRRRWNHWSLAATHRPHYFAIPKYSLELKIGIVIVIAVAQQRKPEATCCFGGQQQLSRQKKIKNKIRKYLPLFFTLSFKTFVLAFFFFLSPFVRFGNTKKVFQIFVTKTNIRYTYLLSYLRQCDLEVVGTAGTNFLITNSKQIKQELVHS